MNSDDHGCFRVSRCAAQGKLELVGAASSAAFRLTGALGAGN